MSETMQISENLIFGLLEKIQGEQTFPCFDNAIFSGSTYGV